MSATLASEEVLIIETPERVPLHFALASIGNRFLACAIDHTIQALALGLIAIASLTLASFSFIEQAELRTRRIRRPPECCHGKPRTAPFDSGLATSQFEHRSDLFSEDSLSTHSGLESGVVELAAPDVHDVAQHFIFSGRVMFFQPGHE